MSYKNLRIYQNAHALAISIHEMSMTLPKFELYEEGSQIRRSSKSIVSNIVEGYGRKDYRNDYLIFLTYALASCDETIEHLKIIFETKSLQDETTFKRLTEQAYSLGKAIANFRAKLKLRCC